MFNWILCAATVGLLAWWVWQMLQAPGKARAGGGRSLEAEPVAVPVPVGAGRPHPVHLPRDEHGPARTGGIPTWTIDGE